MPWYTDFMLAQDSTQRFSSRVENYQRFRPDYPVEVLDLLRSECALAKEFEVADIAYGTGIFTRLLLENGNRVVGVEPNAEMRRAGEQFLAEYPLFTSVAATAEATTLPDHSVDMITAAQAAHWFDPQATRREFLRIIKPGGWIALLWNMRRVDSTPFARDYEQMLLKFATDYSEIRHDSKEAVIAEILIPGYRERIFPWRLDCDYAGVEGRLLSSSYTPGPDDAGYQPMLCELRRIFDEHQINGQIPFDYDTRVYYGQVV